MLLIPPTLMTDYFDGKGTPVVTRGCDILQGVGFEGSRDVGGSSYVVDWRRLLLQVAALALVVATFPGLRSRQKAQSKSSAGAEDS